MDKINLIKLINNKTIELITELHKYLLNNNVVSNKTIEYLNYLVELLGIPKMYLNEIYYDYNETLGGMYISDKGKICINPSLISFIQMKKIMKFNQLFIEYLILIFHEINHALQNLYKKEYNDNVSNILLISDKIINKYPNLILNCHDYIPNEIESNIISSLAVKKLLIDNNEFNVNMLDNYIIKYLTLNLIKNNHFDIQSPIKKIELITNEEYEKYFNNTNELQIILFGLTKSIEMNQKIDESYQTKKLKLDLYEIGGLR